MGSHHGLKQEGWPKVSDVELKNYFASTRSCHAWLTILLTLLADSCYNFD